MEGWIQLHRRILDWDWYSDINTKVLFIHILLKANFKDKSWKGIEIKRGQLFTSVKHLSLEVGLSDKQIRTALKKLQTTKEIAIDGANNGTMITICNYDEYQQDENVKGEQKGEQPDKPKANQGQTKGEQGANQGQQLNNDNKDKNVKKGKKEKNNTSCETSSHTNLKNYFFEFYQKKNKTPYLNWNGKEAAALNGLMRKMTNLHTDQGMDISLPAIENSIRVMFEKITDQWILDHISMALVNSKFSEIISNIKNGRSNTKNGNQSGVSDDYKRDVANRILGNKVPEQV